MRVKNHFRVKGENFGQQEAIFRKMKFTVAAKRLGLGENDFLKSFSPKKNAPLDEATLFLKTPNLKNFRVETHTATPIKPEYLATLAIWTLFTNHSHGSRYHTILADIFCSGQ